VAEGLTIEIEGAKELIRVIEGIDRGLKGNRLREAWERMVEMIGSSAREYAPFDLGYLLASIMEEVLEIDDELVGVIYSDLPYAPFQERGTDPYFPNLFALEDWADRHGMSAWSVAMAILARGVPAKKFFEQSLLENQDEVFELVGNFVAQLLQEEY